MKICPDCGAVHSEGEGGCPICGYGTIARDPEFDQWRPIRSAVQLECLAIIPFVLAPLVATLVAALISAVNNREDTLTVATVCVGGMLYLVASLMIIVARLQAGSTKTEAPGGMAIGAGLVQLLFVVATTTVGVLWIAEFGPTAFRWLAFVGMVTTYFLGVILFSGYLRHLGRYLRRIDIIQGSVWATSFSLFCALNALAIVSAEYLGLREETRSLLAVLMFILVLVFLICYGGVLRRVSRALR